MPEKGDVQIVLYNWVRKRKTNRTISQLVPCAVSLRITETEQLYQAKRMIGLKMGEIQRVTFGELLKHVITLCGQILVSRKLACVFCVVCCAHVETHPVVPAFTGTF